MYRESPTELSLYFFSTRRCRDETPAIHQRTGVIHPAGSMLLLPVLATESIRSKIDRQ
jgi:hypothetical protein